MEGKQLVRTIKMLMEQDLDLLARKNHDYATEDDALSNFKGCGWQGVCFVIGIKVRRLEGLAKGKKPNFESVMDNLGDIGNFCDLARVLYMEETRDVGYRDFLKTSEEYARYG